MRFLIFLFPLFLFSEIRAPTEFKIQERVFSCFSTFDIESEYAPIATAYKKATSIASCYEIYNSSNVLIANTSAQIFSWGTIASVKDGDQNFIGSIEEEVFRIIPWNKFYIYNRDHSLIAIAEMDILGRIFLIYDPNNPNHIFAKITRPLIHIFSDRWQVQILDLPAFENEYFDLRLLSMIAIYQTDIDNRNRISNEIFNTLRNRQEMFEQ